MEVNKTTENEKGMIIESENGQRAMISKQFPTYHYIKELEDKIIKCGIDNHDKLCTIKELKAKVDGKFTEGEVLHLIDEVMNLGMKVRQDQLNGFETRSGNEVLGEYWGKYKKTYEK